MTDLDALERRLLSAARNATSPGPRDQVRVLGAVQRALQDGVVPDVSDEVENVTRVGALAKLALGVVAAGAIGGAGYLAGRHVGFEAGLAAGARQRVVAPVASAPPPAQPTAAEVAREPSTEPGAAEPAKEELGHSSPRLGTAAPAASSSAGDLYEEVRTLRRVERSLRTGNPALAIALLDELDRAVPAGKLLEERAAARATASCEASFGERREHVLARFKQRYAGSVYAARVEKACAAREGEMDAKEGGDSPVEKEHGK